MQAAPKDRGLWMHTSMCKRFYPKDPRPEDISISDIANGLALTSRYSGQGEIGRYYSVAEHSLLMTECAARWGWPTKSLLCVMLHDAAEAYLGDLTSPVKQAVGAGYKIVEERVQNAILEKYGLRPTEKECHLRIKELDQSIVLNEQRYVMRYWQPWPSNAQPLEGVNIRGWSPMQAKIKFLNTWRILSINAGIPQEEYEI